MDSREPTPITSISAPSPFASAAPPPPSTNPPSSSPFAPNSNPSSISQPVQLSFESHAPSPPGSQTPVSYFLNSHNNSGEPLKKKRGRPRKYGPDGGMALALRPASGSSAPGAYDGPTSDPSFKRKGRPPGSGRKKQLEALDRKRGNTSTFGISFKLSGSSGAAFTPHIITVTPGEDVASKIMAFSQQGPRTICVLSANGAISNVTLRQPATSGGLVTYEGRFEIISLSGSFLLAQDGDTRSRTGGLSVALAGSDGRVLGGCVAGMLMASTPVQVVVGSFIAEGKKPKPKPESFSREPISNPPMMKTGPPGPHMAVPTMMKAGPPPNMGVLQQHMTHGFGPVSTGSSPPSDVISDDDESASDDDSGSPINHHMGHNFSNSGAHHVSSGYSPMGWPLSGANQTRHESDMKMMSK
ncbi:AT-hook motif nuclear-localized protein 10 [Rhynchospora pubera]|uniref:AT-hook motif nuclear-localized protein n=1 Tax=Rhynchospora pubera TaxID=906938 RepID=A0AAV8E5X3_9POAL|nr:AT-hook motif nuclear-localized protein 10 [Rhynchospora pubera]